MSVLRIICLSFRNNYRLPDPETIYIKKVLSGMPGEKPWVDQGAEGPGNLWAEA